MGRHNGYKLAKSELLVYADDDIEAFPTWIEGIYESFQDPDVVLVGEAPGSKKDKAEELNITIWNQDKLFEKNL